MSYDAFISYRRSDRITADGVARFLDAFGLTVFVDRSSRAGTAWEPELRAALASAKVLVVLWSRSAAHSDWVEQEWRSVSPSCRIVPIKLDGEKRPTSIVTRHLDNNHHAENDYRCGSRKMAASYCSGDVEQ